MRNAMNKANGVSRMSDNPLALALDETEFSMMSQGGRKFPFYGAHEAPKGDISEEIVRDAVQKLLNDENEAIAAYIKAAHENERHYPEIAYLFRVITDEERNHRKILQEIQASVVGREPFMYELNFGDTVNIIRGIYNGKTGTIAGDEVVTTGDYPVKIGDETVFLAPGSLMKVLASMVGDTTEYPKFTGARPGYGYDNYSITEYDSAVNHKNRLNGAGIEGKLYRHPNGGWVVEFKNI